MNRLVILTTAALAFAGPAGPGAQERGVPSIEIPQTKLDLGRVYEREKYEYVFTVHNRGKAELRIEEVKPGCGCTAAKFDRVIAPGGQGTIELVVNGSQVEGTFSKTAQVVTNDPSNPELTLTVAANEIAYVAVTPSGTIFLQGRYGEPVEKVLTLTSNEPELDFKVTGLTSTIDDKITYTVASGQKKGEYSLTVKKNPALPTSSLYGSLYVHTNSTRAPKLTLQVQVIAKGSISVSPTILNFGPVQFATKQQPAPPVTAAVMVSKATGPLEISEVTIDNPRFVAHVQALSDTQYRISVTFTPPLKSAPRQNEKAEMTIHTDDEREPAVRVQVVARTL